MNEIAKILWIFMIKVQAMSAEDEQNARRWHKIQGACNLIVEELERIQKAKAKK